MKYGCKTQLTHNGKTQSLRDWAEEIGISYKTIVTRLNVQKWDVDKALTAVPDCKLKPASDSVKAGIEIREGIRQSFLSVWQRMGRKEFERQLEAAFNEDAVKTVQSFNQFLPKDLPDKEHTTIENLAIKIELATPATTPKMIIDAT